MERALEYVYLVAVAGLVLAWALVINVGDSITVPTLVIS